MDPHQQNASHRRAPRRHRESAPTTPPSPNAAPPHEDRTAPHHTQCPQTPPTQPTPQPHPDEPRPALDPRTRPHQPEQPPHQSPPQPQHPNPTTQTRPPTPPPHQLFHPEPPHQRAHQAKPPKPAPPHSQPSQHSNRTPRPPAKIASSFTYYAPPLSRAEQRPRVATTTAWPERPSSRNTHMAVHLGAVRPPIRALYGWPVLKCADDPSRKRGVPPLWTCKKLDRADYWALSLSPPRSGPSRLPVRRGCPGG